MHINIKLLLPLADAIVIVVVIRQSIIYLNRQS